MQTPINTSRCNRKANNTQKHQNSFSDKLTLPRNRGHTATSEQVTPPADPPSVQPCQLASPHPQPRSMSFNWRSWATCRSFKIWFEAVATSIWYQVVANLRLSLEDVRKTKYRPKNSFHGHHLFVFPVYFNNDNILKISTPKILKGFACGAMCPAFIHVMLWVISKMFFMSVSSLK